MNRVSRKRNAISAVLFVAAPLVTSLAVAEGDWGGSVGVAVSQDDNARKSDVNQIEERQDEATARLYADYKGSWYLFDADYTARYLNYSKDSQDDRNQLDGRASLFLGKPKGWASLAVGNERRSVYNAPEDAPISENLDDRSVWYVEPSLIARFGSVNSLTLAGRAEQVSYRYNSLRDSEPKTASLTFQRDVSSVSFFQAYGGVRSVEYPNGTLDDYENQFGGIAWNSRLRLLSYELKLGYNKATFEDNGADYEAPSVYLTLDYNSSVNRFLFELSQDITDTSSGSALLDDVPENPEADGVGVDQIERQRARAVWTSQGLCGRCETTLGYRYQYDDYRRDIRDGSTEAFTAGFRYRFSESLRSFVQYERSKLDYRSDALFGYEADRIDVRLEKTLGAQLAARVFYSYEQRQAQVDYDQNILGIGLTYTFK
ncbi:hypothetical protein [Simiduia agarivorans]|uniref:Uncharacterized protein n=1 Tax=Simiduia agarivorans (strain DSM 21679 / JCM 13881 / BCRC 17597 / SA1) TaxID=1117647 RepID=K4KL58_SIMAS|nr:hypothetical protein [Simiduia agarivorans]AFU98965.1 hypothetical protein M5M_08890 [Simiduia agarivorans SA1 = DSM 21679]